MKIRIEFDSLAEAVRVNRKLIEALADGKDMENITKLLEVNYRIIDALASGKVAVMVSDINAENFADTIAVPDSDKCGCYHNGYCWGTKEIDQCYCFGRKSRCTFYKKGI